MELHNTGSEDPQPEDRKKKAGKTDQRTGSKRQKTVRGSGFTYDEDKGRTDQSIPLSDSETAELNKLPDLGKRNRP
jgi:hypothetical protein